MYLGIVFTLFFSLQFYEVVCEQWLKIIRDAYLNLCLIKLFAFVKNISRMSLNLVILLIQQEENI